MRHQLANQPLGSEDRSPSRRAPLDALRGLAVLWMTAYHFCFDLNYFGWIHQNFNGSLLWTAQRTCILSLFLACAGAGQALGALGGQSWGRFFRRWWQIAFCALLVSVGSAQMFPTSWIYFGVLHGMALMLLICRMSRKAGALIWILGLLFILLGWNSATIQLHLMQIWPALYALNTTAWNWLGLVSFKPFTEDYVPLLPWLGVMLWGMAAAFWLENRRQRLPIGHREVGHSMLQKSLAFVGRWSLTWYMVHQLVLIGLFTLLSDWLHQAF